VFSLTEKVVINHLFAVSIYVQLMTFTINKTNTKTFEGREGGAVK
jgi:hypothetical protein